MSGLELDVWVADVRVGSLVQENYEYVFQYEGVPRLDPERHLVSLTMPVRVKQYDTQILMPPFQGSLPEGALLENLRNRFGKLMDIGNDMVLLRLIGNNTIGRVRFSPAGREVEPPETSTYSLNDLLKYPEAEPLFLELLDRFSRQSGVSGVQPKVLWTERSGRIALRHQDYILKSGGREYPGIAVNEFFCLQAAREAGLKTPEHFLSENGELLAIKRFDISSGGGYLAFEEVCGLMNRPNHGKYLGSYEAVADLLQRIPCRPVAQTNRDIFKSVTFSMLIKNGDAHLKNFGVVYDNARDVALAPFYDLVNTTVYLPKDLPALTLADSKTWPQADALLHFGLNACNLRKKEARACMEEVRAGIHATVPKIERYGRHHSERRSLCKELAAVFRNC